MVFGPWHEEQEEEEEGGGDGDFDLPPNGSQLHAQAETPSRPKRKRHAKLGPVVGVDREAAPSVEKKAKGAPTRREKPEIGFQTRAAPIPFVLDAAAGGFGATDFLKVRYDDHVVLSQPHANREKK